MSVRGSNSASHRKFSKALGHRVLAFLKGIGFASFHLSGWLETPQQRMHSPAPGGTYHTGRVFAFLSSS